MTINNILTYGKVTHEASVYVTKSIADVILSSDLPAWRKWLLKKLIPLKLYEAPPITLCKLQKGDMIGKVIIETTNTV